MIGDMAGGAGLLAEMVNKNIQRQNYVDACDSAEAWKDACMTWRERAKELEKKFLIEKTSHEADLARRAALEKELKLMAPNHRLFQVIGVNNKGASVTPLMLIGWEEFDKKLPGRLGAVDPKKYRTYRVK